MYIKASLTILLSLQSTSAVFGVLEDEVNKMTKRIEMNPTSRIKQVKLLNIEGFIRNKKIDAQNVIYRKPMCVCYMFIKILTYLLT